MELDLFIILFFLAIAMVGIHIFFNPIIGRKKGKRGDELPKISPRRLYSRRRRRYKDRE